MAIVGSIAAALVGCTRPPLVTDGGMPWEDGGGRPLWVPRYPGTFSVFLRGHSWFAGTGSSDGLGMRKVYRDAIATKGRAITLNGFAGTNPYKHGGVSGESLDELAARIVSDVETYGGTLTYLLTGRNDMNTADDAAAAPAKLAAVLDIIEGSTWEGELVLVTGGLDLNATINTRIVTIWNPAVRAEAAARGLRVMEQEGVYSAADHSDNTHLNDAGYQTKMAPLAELMT